MRPRPVLLELVPDPLSADPVEVLVSSGLATRRAFGEHFRTAPFMAATTQSDRHMVAIIALMTNVFDPTRARRRRRRGRRSTLRLVHHRLHLVRCHPAHHQRRDGRGKPKARSQQGAPPSRIRSGSRSGSGSGLAKRSGPGRAERLGPSPAEAAGSGKSAGIHHALDEMLDVSITDPQRLRGALRPGTAAPDSRLHSNRISLSITRGDDDGQPAMTTVSRR